MAEVVGIDAGVLRDVARIYATSKASIIFWGMGISQHTHGTDNARCLIALALITGQIGRPGTGLHPLRGQNNVQGASDAGLIPMYFPDYKSVEKLDIRGWYENFWGQTLDPKRGLTVVEIMDAVHEGEITGMYIMGENPAMSDPDQDHARAALAKLDHLVVQDIFLTETAWYADVVLPASAHAEKLGTYTNTNRQVQMGRPALDLPGEARQDWELIVELARRIGLDWKYGHVSDVYAEMAATMPSLKNISWERVDREDSVIYPAKAPDVPGDKIAFTDGFPTADGRGKIVPADLLPPDEVPDRGVPARADDRPVARALAHRLHDAPGRRARRDRARRHRRDEPARHAEARSAARRQDHRRDPARRARRYLARRPRSRGGFGVHAVLLRREPGEPAHESEARSDRQDSRVQVLRCTRRASAATDGARSGGDGHGGMIVCG